MSEGAKRGREGGAGAQPKKRREEAKHKEPLCPKRNFRKGISPLSKQNKFPRIKLQGNKRKLSDQRGHSQGGRKEKRRERFSNKREKKERKKRKKRRW